VGENMVIGLTLMVGDEYVHEFEGVVMVTLPYTPPYSFYNYELLAVFYIDYLGNTTEMEDSVFYDGLITFTTTHFSLFFIDERIENIEDLSNGIPSVINMFMAILKQFV